MAINFNQVGSFKGIQGGSDVLENPTSLQFGADGRLYVAEQNGTINAFTIEIKDGEYLATDHETLELSNGAEVVKSIQNHNDDGSSTGNKYFNRQVTGLVVTGTAENPVLYVSSSDPRIAVSKDSNLDTNSGVVTRVTWNGNNWEAVDIVRGLPRSEENHSVNGMVLSEDGTKLYLTVGGNTNNGAPSDFFAYTGEYALSGTILEIDLEDIESREILTDPSAGQKGTARQYIYDLPTLDDPTVENVTDGVGEDEFGMDENNPWGGNDGLNMAILPADAPMRIYADGLRNQYDIVLTQKGQLFTIDNGSNNNLGGNPVDANGNPTEEAEAGLATNKPNDGGSGDPEPLFLLEDGGYYGHPVPSRANQQVSWTVYDNDGNPDESLSVNQVASLADLVPEGLNIADGFIIDPSKFTSDSTRLAESGIRIERDGADSNAIVNIGSSSNGLAEYTSSVFGGALQGSLLVAQFNGNVTLLNLSEDAKSIQPLIDPTDGGATIDDDGIYPLVTGQSLPLDVTVGLNGTVWVAEFGADNINVFAPSDIVLPENLDIDNDGILNVDDPFIRDSDNGSSVVLLPGQTLLWDFDANQDNNLPGLDGYGGGLTGVMIDGVRDFEKFFQEPSTISGQIVNLDNVKFSTAAGGGTTVIESVSDGTAHKSANDGEYLFHTGVTIAPIVETFNIKWSVYNPGSDFVGSDRQIGGYIGTGDQSNYLKIVAIAGAKENIQILLEDNDVVESVSYIQADDLFDVPAGQQIYFELEVDPEAETVTPTVSYETGNGKIETVSGKAIDLSKTNVLDAIQGEYQVNGQETGLAVGLFSSNAGQSQANTFQAIFNDIEITATGDITETVLYRVNAGGSQVAATDGGMAWSADTILANSSFLSDSGSNNTASFSAVEPGATIAASVPGAIFNTERWDRPNDSSMQWAFDVPQDGLYEVRLYTGNGYSGASDPGERVFDVAVEGNVPSEFNNIDPSSLFGHQIGGVISSTVIVDDGTLDLEFLHGVQNPQVNGIEIVRFDKGDGETPTTEGSAILTVNSGNNNIQTSTYSKNSFKITNTGDKKIVGAELDITNALYPDTVFDPFGQGGDKASKPLTITKDGKTGVIAPSDSSYIGVGGNKGYEAIQLIFDEQIDGGFESQETVIFSIDMDPNSIAGSDKKPLDGGTNPGWDVGGVSGAELIGSTFTVTFDDGTTSTGQLQGDNSNAGSQTLASQSITDVPVALTVNNLEAGSTGTYEEDPSVIIQGSAGETARVVLTKGFIQPVSLDLFLSGTAKQQQYAPLLQSQLDILAASDFPANNAVEFQTVDVLLTGKEQDITNLFDFSEVASFDFEGEDQLPLGFVASAIDPANDDLPIGSVTQPIYLQFEEPDTVVNPPTPVSSFIIEAEDITDVTGYRIEKNFIASGNELLSLVKGAKNELGSASFTFSEVSGNYNVVLGTYDESDGKATIQITQEGTAIGSVKLDEKLGGKGISPNTKVEKLIATNISIDRGDNFTVNGLENGGEHARFDYVKFELLGSSQNESGDSDGNAVNTPIRIEAENADTIVNYRTEDISGASQEQILSFKGKAKNEMGSASFTFDEPAGAYDVVLGTYDESDGKASFDVTLNGSQIGDLILDSNLGSNLANAQTAVSETIAFGVDLTPGDILTVNGFENAGEHARIDYLEFVPVEF